MTFSLKKTLPASLAVVSAMLLFSCNASHTDKGNTTEQASAYKKFPSEKVIAFVKEETLRPKTYEASFRIFGQNASGTLRIVPGEKVWFNIAVLGMTVARGMMTPDSLMYYERMGRTAFAGTWPQAQALLGQGVPFNYSDIENLLLGNPIFDPALSENGAKAGERGYFIQDKDYASTGKALLVNPRYFRPEEQYLFYPRVSTALTAVYTHTKAGRYFIASKIRLNCLGMANFDLEISFFSQKLNKEVQTPFKKPAEYKSPTLYLK